MPTTLVKLSDLTRYGAPPLSEEKLLDSAERTRKELLAGLARRVSGLVLLGLVWRATEGGEDAMRERWRRAAVRADRWTVAGQDDLLPLACVLRIVAWLLRLL